MKNIHKWLIGLLLIIIIAIPVVAIDSWIKIDDRTYIEKEGEKITYWKKSGATTLKELEARKAKLVQMQNEQINPENFCNALTREQLIEMCLSQIPEPEDYTEEINELNKKITKLKQIKGTL